MSVRRPIVIGLVLASALGAAPALSRAEASDRARTPGQARAAYTITASVNKAEPLRGKKVTIKGWVRPALPGGRIALQRELTGGDGWQTIDRAHLSKASTYRFTFRVIPAREHAYRVVKPI